MFDETRPGIFNLLTIYELFSGQTRAQIEAHFAGKGYADFKRELGDLVVESLRPLQARYAELTRDPSTLDGILREAADFCARLAAPTLLDVQRAMGLR